MAAPSPRFEPLSFEVAKLRFVPHFLICLVFLVFGVLMIVEGGDDMWGATVFFGLCTAIFVWRLVRREKGPRLVIDENGVYDRSLGVGVIRWEDVKDANVIRIAGHPLLKGEPFLCLTVRDPDAYLQRLHPAKRWLARTNRRFVSADLSIALGDLRGADPEALARLIRAQVSERTPTGYRRRLN